MTKLKPCELCWILVLVSLFVGLFALITVPSVVSYEAKKEEIKKEKDKLDLWLEELAKLECRGCVHRGGADKTKILEINGKYSYGCLQFQEQKFYGMAKKYGLSGIVAANGESAIYSCEIQKQIAREMLEDNPSNARHWYTSVYVKGLGLPPVEKNEQTHQS